jgi:hypothetical protein
MEHEIREVVALLERNAIANERTATALEAIAAKMGDDQLRKLTADVKAHSAELGAALAPNPPAP